MIPPPIQRGMTLLNRDLFRCEIRVVGVRVPTSLTAEFLKVLNKDLFNQPRLRNVVEDPESNSSKIVLMNLNVKSLELVNVSNEAKNFIKREGIGTVKHSIELKYDYWGVDDILKAILPEGSETPSSYTQVGHIAHINLRDEFLPWKNIIGQVILDKTPNISTVVNKTDIIDTTYRFFKMEILAGENNMIAEVVGLSSKKRITVNFDLIFHKCIGIHDCILNMAVW